MSKIKFIVSFILILVFVVPTFSQPVPAEDENIPFLMLFGKKAETSWGDDDFVQTFFFVIPEKFNKPIYIRVFDPDCGGENDELNGAWDTQTSFSIYGGKKSWSDEASQAPHPDKAGKYKSGNLLATKSFAGDAKYDNGWYTFGPFNPTEGEYVAKFSGNVFKVISEGSAGDDGNMYRYYLTTDPANNKAVEGANAFAYEYSFRMWDDGNQVSHIYPYIDDKTISIKESNFDWDNDGILRIVSVARKGQIVKTSGDDNWAEEESKVLPEEKNTSLDIQMIKNKAHPVKNNNVVVFVTNQYGELLPFFTIPIGGVPKYKYGISVKQKQ